MADLIKAAELGLIRLEGFHKKGLKILAGNCGRRLERR
jgi:hypothetical protein